MKREDCIERILNFLPEGIPEELALQRLEEEDHRRLKKLASNTDRRKEYFESLAIDLDIALEERSVILISEGESVQKANGHHPGPEISGNGWAQIIRHCRELEEIEGNA